MTATDSAQQGSLGIRTCQQKQAVPHVTNSPAARTGNKGVRLQAVPHEPL